MTLTTIPRAKLGRPKGSQALRDLSAARARSLWRIDPDTGKLIWLVDRGKVKAGTVCGAAVQVDGCKFRTNRVTVLISTGSWPGAGRIPRDAKRAVANKPVLYTCWRQGKPLQTASYYERNRDVIRAKQREHYQARKAAQQPQLQATTAQV